MAQFDLGKELKGRFQKAVDSAKDIKLPDVELKKPDIKAAADDVKEFFKIKSKDEGAEKDNVEPTEMKALSTKSALKIIYYLMAVDGEVFHGEESQYDLIGRELDPSFDANKNQIVQECQAQLSQATVKEDFYDVIQDGVEDALLASRQTADTFITPKLLIWDLLTIAYSDGGYDEAERKLIKYVARRTDVDKAIFLEMESSILTMMDIEKELTWIRSTDRPYRVVEPIANELADRKNVIYESVKDLISL